MRSLIALWMLFIPMVSLAQQTKDPMAKALLDKVSNKYKGISSYSADFVYELRNNQTKESDEMKGKVAVNGDKYQMTAIGQEVYNDGKTICTVIKESGYCEVTINDPDPDDPFSPSNALNLYKNEFKYFLEKEQVTIDGKSHDVVELSPMNPNSDKYGFFKAKLYIDTQTKLLKRWVFFEKGNISRTTITIKNFKMGTHDNASVFTFDHKGYCKKNGCECIDLRL